jgi:drug/metabolite transporter (DMT)-like permease
MAPVALGLALSAAVVHAVWNLILARQRDPEAATAVAMAAGVLLFAPVAAFSFNVEREAIPFIAVTAILQLVYFAALAAAYRHSELSVVYPIARGVAPVIVLIAGVVIVGSSTSAAQIMGVTLVAIGVLLVRGVQRDGQAHGVAFGLAIASVIAAYTLVDSRGVLHADPIAYLELAMAPAAAGYLVIVATRRRGVERIRRATSGTMVVAGALSFVAYVLVLAALERAPAAAVAAVRETSIVVATALAARVLGERVTPGRLVGAALVVAGVALLGL